MAKIKYFKQVSIPITTWYEKFLLLFKRRYISQDGNIAVHFKTMFGNIYVIKIVDYNVDKSCNSRKGTKYDG